MWITDEIKATNARKNNGRRTTKVLFSILKDKKRLQYHWRDEMDKFPGIKYRRIAENKVKFRLGCRGPWEGGLSKGS